MSGYEARETLVRHIVRRYYERGIQTNETGLVATAHAAIDVLGPPAEQDAEATPGCDCAELCSMGPTCPGAILAGLAGSGCHRVQDAEATATRRAAPLTEAEIERVRDVVFPPHHDDPLLENVLDVIDDLLDTRARVDQEARAVAARVYPCARCGGSDVLGRTPGRNVDLTVCEVCAMKVEAEYGPAAQQVAVVREVLADPELAWWHTGGTRCVPLHALRDALAVAETSTGDGS